MFDTENKDKNVEVPSFVESKDSDIDMSVFNKDEEYDEYFAYIAGYTSGGAPYGLTWEELGIDTSLPIEERLKKLAEL